MTCIFRAVGPCTDRVIDGLSENQWRILRMSKKKQEHVKIYEYQKKNYLVSTFGLNFIYCSRFPLLSTKKTCYGYSREEQRAYSFYMRGTHTRRYAARQRVLIKCWQLTAGQVEALCESMARLMALFISVSFSRLACSLSF